MKSIRKCPCAVLLLYQPNPLSHYPTHPQGSRFKISDLFSASTLFFFVKGSRKWLRESNFKGHELCAGEPGTRTRIQMQIEADASSMAALKAPLLGQKKNSNQLKLILLVLDSDSIVLAEVIAENWADITASESDRRRLERERAQLECLR